MCESMISVSEPLLRLHLFKMKTNVCPLDILALKVFELFGFPTFEYFVSEHTC
jgi:hypothetical protein